MITRLRPEGRRRQDDARVQPRGRHRPARPADRPHRRQPPVRRPARAAQGADRRAVDPRPADRPDRGVGPGDVLWRDPSGIDILLAPPRIEMAEMVTVARPREDPLAPAPRLRASSSSTRAPPQRHQPRVPRRVRHDPRDRHLRLDDDPQHDGHGRHVPGDRLSRRPRSATSSTGPTRPAASTRATSRGRSAASRSTASCPTGSSSSRRTTRASRSCWPTRRPPISQDVMRDGRASCSAPRGSPPAPRGAEAAMSDPRPIGVFDSGVGGLTVLREILRRSPARIHDLPRRQRPRAVRRPRPTTRSCAFSTAGARRARRARRQGASSSPATPPRPSPCRDLRRRYDLPVLGVVRPGAVGGGPGHPQPAGRRHRHAGHGPLARLLQGDQGREPGGRGLRARHAGARADGRGRRS